MLIHYGGREYQVDVGDRECVSYFCKATGLDCFQETICDKHLVFFNPEQYRVKLIAHVPILIFKGNTKTPEQPINLSHCKMMFALNKTLESIDLSSWDWTGIKDIYRMFFNCVNLKYCKTKFSKIPFMSAVFEGCTSLESADTQDWDMQETQDVSACFKGCEKLRMLDVLNWDVSKLRYLSELCYSCGNLESFEAADWNTSQVLLAESVFAKCSKLLYVDITNWNLRKARSIASLFSFCESIYYLKWDGLELYGLSEQCITTHSFLGCKAQNTRIARLADSDSKMLRLKAF